MWGFLTSSESLTCPKVVTESVENEVSCPARSHCERLSSPSNSDTREPMAKVLVESGELLMLL
jgi:hypothetical protein